MRRWRAHVPGDWSPGDRVPLSPADTRHVLKVLRLQAGDEMAVFNGRGAEWAGTLTLEDSGVAAVILERRLTDEVEPGVVISLYQGMCRADRLEWILQKGTEIGIHDFHLVRTSRSEPLRWTETKATRWRRILQEACKQSGRRWLPDLVGPIPLGGPAVIDPGGSVSIVLVCRPGRPSLSSILADADQGPVRILVGPESGLTEAEIDLLVEAGWVPASMGPRILRTETAGLAAAALVLGARGDI